MDVFTQRRLTTPEALFKPELNILSYVITSRSRMWILPPAKVEHVCWMFLLCEPLKLLNITLSCCILQTNVYLTSKIVNLTSANHSGLTRTKLSLVCFFVRQRLLCVRVYWSTFCHRSWSSLCVFKNSGWLQTLRAVSVFFVHVSYTLLITKYSEEEHSCLSFDPAFVFFLIHLH